MSAIIASVYRERSFVSPRKMKKTTTQKQFEVLVNYLRNHSDLAVGFATSSEAKVKRRQMWIRLTDRLNDNGPPVRNCMEWKSIWSDYKYNLKRKLAADLKLARRKQCDKRLPFNKTEQAVIELLGIKDKNINFNKYNRKTTASEVAIDPVIETSSSQYNAAGSDVEIDENKEGIMITDDFDSKISVSVINNAIHPQEIAEEYLEMPEEINISGMTEDTLMSIHKTQQAILEELKELNRQQKHSNKLKERELQIKQGKLDEQKQHNYEQNKQAYIKIELKRRELELYEIKVKGLRALKEETD